MSEAASAGPMHSGSTSAVSAVASGSAASVNSVACSQGTTAGVAVGLCQVSGPEANKRALYVGGLDPRVTELVLRQIFETAGNVISVKIIPDKNLHSQGFNYGFVEYDDTTAAERALQTLNGRRIHQSEIRVNWAYQSNHLHKIDTSNHFHLFVGDLSNEVNDEVLRQAFLAFGPVSEARVMWDMKTGRSRGFGFVAFKERADADKALRSMDGEYLGSRAIRCNWANQRGQPPPATPVTYQHRPSLSHAPGAMNMNLARASTVYGYQTQAPYSPHGTQTYDIILHQTPRWQTTCYVGNLNPYTSQQELVTLFQSFGYVVECRIQSDRGYAFVKMDTHENAAMAICQLNGYQVSGRPLKCSWGKDRPPPGQMEGYPVATSAAGAYYPRYCATPAGPLSSGGQAERSAGGGGNGFDGAQSGS